MQRLKKTNCQPYMKNIFFTILALATFSCTKEKAEAKGDLLFHSITLVKEATVNGEIKAEATIVGPNLCYAFTHFEVSSKNQNQYDIYVKGRVPQPGQICAQALYTKDTTVTISKPTPGTYILNFWNPNNQLFKSETVIVN